MFTPTLSSYIEYIAANCKKDTSADPDNWTVGNPTWGHCVMIAVLTQELYGGDIWRASLLHIPQFARMRSHYGNRLPTGVHLDLTAPQFGEEYPLGLEPKRSSRTYVLGTPATLARYAVFHERFERLAFQISLRESLRTSAPRGDERRVVPRRPKK